MKFTYRLVQDASGWIAECVEADAMGEGKTERDAVTSLRNALEERMFRPDAIAPPASQPRPAIDLTPAGAEPERRSLDLGGPGDPAPRP